MMFNSAAQHKRSASAEAAGVPKTDPRSSGSSLQKMSDPYRAKKDKSGKTAEQSGSSEKSEESD
jgi:hypothetical protein